MRTEVCIEVYTSSSSSLWSLMEVGREIGINVRLEVWLEGCKSGMFKFAEVMVRQWPGTYRGSRG